MRLLRKFFRKIYHFIAFLSIFLLFSPEVNAVVNIGGTAFEQSPQVNFYDNTGGNLTSVGASYSSSPGYWVSNDNLITTGGDYDGANVGFTINGTFVAGYTYSLSILIGMESSSVKWSSTRLCTAENLVNAAYRFSHSEYTCTNAFSTVVMSGVANFDYNGYSLSYGMITYVFTADFTAPTISVVYQSNTGNNSRHIFGGYHLETIAQPNNGLTQQQVQSIVSNSGLATANSVSQVQQSITQIQTDINNSANNIIDNQNSNTQDIIDNQDENTAKTTETIENNFNDCGDHSITILFDSAPSVGYGLSSSGALTSNSNYNVSNYIKIKAESSYTLKLTSKIYNALSYCLYTEDKTLISCSTLSGRTSISFTSPTNASYFRTTIAENSTLTGFTCINRIDGLSDSITNSTIDSPNSTISSLENNLPTNSVISDLILLPVTLLQSIINSIGGTCSSFSLGSLYGTNLVMPCIDLSSYLGTTIWTFIDLVFSGMFILVIRKKFLQIWHNITNLKTGGNEVD